MKNDYGSLRRRTRDASWQWLFMGLMLGMGFALVVCVGGYALGAISFPALESDTATPQVQIMPNETEVALQQLSAQQTQEASPQAVATEEATPSDAASPPATTTEGDVTTASVTAEATPSPLPAEATSGGGETALPAPTNAEVTPAPDAETGTAPQDRTQLAPAAQDTPVLGTPPVTEAPAEIGLPGPPAIPPELDAIKTELVTITGGTFMMGTTKDEAIQAMEECALYGKVCEDLSWVSDSFPPHQTTVDSFAMEVYEVSVLQYVTFLNWMGPNSHKTHCQGQPCAFTTREQENSYIEFDGTVYAVRNPEFYGNHPVTFVTWWGAAEYCNTLNRRLPTEAEWERAARGSQNRVYPWGFEFDPQRAASSIAEQIGTVPVISYPNGASPYGVFNMAGNVSEWVFDWYQVDYYNQQLTAPEPNPKGPVAGTEKVHRGGSWDTAPLFLRSVHRLSAPPGNPSASIGFRCAADISPVQTSGTPPVSGATTGGETTVPAGAPTLPPPPTQIPLPTSTPIPSGPTATLAPG